MVLVANLEADTVDMKGAVTTSLVETALIDLENKNCVSHVDLIIIYQEIAEQIKEVDFRAEEEVIKEAEAEEMEQMLGKRDSMKEVKRIVGETTVIGGIITKKMGEFTKIFR